MKTFPKNIERWRSMVGSAYSDVLVVMPGAISLTNRFKTIISDWSDLFLAIIQKESSGDEFALGDDGNSVGLMQLNYGAGTPQDAGYKGTKSQLFDPYTNIYYGIKTFLRQLDRYEDVEKAILAYNAGSYRTKDDGTPINLSYLETVWSYLTEKKTSLPSVSPSPDSSSSISAQEKSKTEAAPIVSEPVVKLPHPFIQKIYLPVFFIVSLSVSIVAFLCN